jgi:hypothetical protein
MARLLLLMLTLLAGCTTGPVNPSFDVDLATASDRIDAIEEEPIPLERPVLVLGGWFDPGFVASRLRKRFRKAFDTQHVASCAFPFAGSFDNCRKRVLCAVDEAFPNDDPMWTTEVDVVAVSMGGLVARYAAAEHEAGRRLRIRRLFTIATPHRGAAMAGIPTFDRLVIDMRAGSEFLATVDAALPHVEYELIPYVRLDDTMVGAENAAPEGEVPWWVPNKPLEGAHLKAAHDARILADIMLRLRSETPFTTEPRTPLPD